MIIFIQMEFDERRERQRPKRAEVDGNEEIAEGPGERAILVSSICIHPFRVAKIKMWQAGCFFRIKVAAQQLCGNIRISKKKLSFIKSVNLAVLI